MGLFLIILILVIFGVLPLAGMGMFPLPGYLSIGVTWDYAYDIANLLSPGAIHFATPSQSTEIPVVRLV